MDRYKELTKLFKDLFGKEPEKIVPLPVSGSARDYYRLSTSSNSGIGVYYKNTKENFAFTEFSKHFKKIGLNVPEILSANIEKNVYLLNDLGDTTLFSYMQKLRKGDDFPQEIFDLYKKAIHDLVEFQVDGSKRINFDLSYPRSAFDKQSMMWDLNYFKYYFLKLADIDFHEQDLENDFNTLTQFLLEAGQDYFLYRDFQSRNIMIKDSKLFYIDYQGGRKGPLHYDIASLLYDAKADIPTRIREELLEYYIESAGKKVVLLKEEFIEYFYGFVFIRIMQAMGAYGYRGFYERKDHFLKSIPFVLKNLEWLLKNNKLPVSLPELVKCYEQILNSSKLKMYGEKSISEKLTVTINSFSYKKGLPNDYSGNGGGFMFDCRSLPNPGRLDEYKLLTGRDKPVIEYLSEKKEVDEFLSKVYSIVDSSVQNYIDRGFLNLMVNFGCTGGQHRSVYCAENLFNHLQKLKEVNIVLNHNVIGN